VVFPDCSNKSHDINELHRGYLSFSSVANPILSKMRLAFIPYGHL
jgi:hypothetical protein